MNTESREPSSDARKEDHAAVIINTERRLSFQAITTTLKIKRRSNASACKEFALA